MEHCVSCSFHVFSSTHAAKACRCAGLFFFFQITSSYTWLRFQYVSFFSLSSCTQQNNLGTAGAKLLMALAKKIKNGIMNWEGAFGYTAISSLIAAYMKGWKCDKRWVIGFRVRRSQRRQRIYWICATLSGDLTYTLTQQMWITAISLALDNCFLPFIGITPMSVSS